MGTGLVYTYFFVRGFCDPEGDQVHTVVSIPSGLWVQGLCNTGEHWLLYPFSAGGDQVHIVVWITAGFVVRGFFDKGRAGGSTLFRVGNEWAQTLSKPLVDGFAWTCVRRSIGGRDVGL